MLGFALKQTVFEKICTGQQSEKPLAKSLCISNGIWKIWWRVKIGHKLFFTNFFQNVGDDFLAKAMYTIILITVFKMITYMQR